MLAKSKLNSIKALIFQALIDLEGLKNFKLLLLKKKKTKKWKEVLQWYKVVMNYTKKLKQ